MSLVSGQYLFAFFPKKDEFLVLMVSLLCATACLHWLGGFFSLALPHTLHFYT